MYEYGQTEEQQPVMYVRGYPVYAAYLLVAAFVASMLATTILMGASVARVWDWLPFTSAGVLRGQVWRALTYGLLNPPSLNFAIDMVILAWFGREVEKFLGRTKFGLLFAGIYLLPPLLLTLVGIWFPASFFGERCVLAVFIAFATIYPDVGIFFGVPSKWVAAILVGIYTLMDLANHAWQDGLTLWATCGFAYAFTRVAQGLVNLPSFRLFRGKPRLRVVPGITQGAEASPAAAKGNAMAEVDALLDKIATSGFSSLTAKERARLDSARDELSKRGTRR
jgi:membrane associated rhomboid family serine protease